MSRLAATSTRPAVVEVREVGPRDGLQDCDVALETSEKVDLIRRCAAAGVGRIEAGSFVSPKAVPKMSDSAEVFKALADDGLHLEALVVNETGARCAIECGASGLVAVVAATETFSQANTRMSIAAALGQAERIAAAGSASGLSLSVDIAVAFGCPYENQVPGRDVIALACRLIDLGYREIFLADTAARAKSQDVIELVGSLDSVLPAEVRIGLHLHDGKGQGLANVLAGLDAGVRLFDSSVAGLGGCPYSPRASGNVATEDLLEILSEAGLDTSARLDDVRLLGEQLKQRLDELRDAAARTASLHT